MQRKLLFVMGAVLFFTFGQAKQLVYGGDHQDIYLGCLSCDRFDADSIQNTYGQYGSKFSPYSLVNVNGKFGAPKSNFSPCNKFAFSPPVVKNESGQVLGILNIDPTRPNTFYDKNAQSLLREVICRN